MLKIPTQVQEENQLDIYKRGRGGTWTRDLRILSPD